MVIISKITSSHELTVNPEYASGRAHCSGTGKVFLAYLPGEKLEEYLKRYPLKKFASRTITSRAELFGELEKVRRNGYALAADEGCDGVVVVGVPVRGREGTVMAALGIGLPTLRFKGGHREATIRELLKAGGAVSRKFNPV